MIIDAMRRCMSSHLGGQAAMRLHGLQSLVRSFAVPTCQNQSCTPLSFPSSTKMETSSRTLPSSHGDIFNTTVHGLILPPLSCRAARSFDSCTCQAYGEGWRSPPSPLSMLLLVGLSMPPRAHGFSQDTSQKDGCFMMKSAKYDNYCAAL